MKKFGLIVFLALFQLNAHAQPTLCDVLRAIFMDGKSGYTTFYGPNNGAIGYKNEGGVITEGFILNDSKTVRKDMLNGQTFVDGSIFRYDLGMIYEDELSLKYYQWNFNLNGPSVDYSSVPDSIREASLIADLESIGKQLQENCFAELALSSSLHSTSNKTDTVQIAKITICSKDALMGDFFSLALNPFTPNLTISVNKDAIKENFYHITYQFYYPVEK